MSLAALERLAAKQKLENFGTLPTQPSDELGEGTLVLLGPHEPGFWQHVTDTAEFTDGKDDPLDRWSERVIDDIATEVDGTALFPFGTPVQPFISWALRSGRAWQSPVTLLVHDKAGLMVSYRGAILLPETLSHAHPMARPCETCDAQPCRVACPVNALTEQGYDLNACHAFLDTPAGKDDLSRGCAVRRACPVSQNYGRSEGQSAFHMERFHPWR